MNILSLLLMIGHTTPMSFLRWCRHHWFILGLLLAFLLPFLAFSRSLLQDFAAIDDTFLIINNPTVHGIDLTHLKLAFTTFDPELYIPLTLLSFQIDWLVGAGSPVMFHLTNLLLQGLNAVLVGFFVFLLLQGKNSAKGVALTVSLLFAVHPLHTEAVVWAAGRKDLLSTFLFLGSVNFFSLYLLTSLPPLHCGERGGGLSFSEHKIPSPSQWRRDGDEDVRRHFLYALSLLAFVLGLLSKVLIATLPAVLILIFLMHRHESMRKELVKLAPYFILSAIFLYVALFGKERIIASSSLLDTVLMAQKSAFFYIEKLLFPVGLTVIYPFQSVMTLASPQFFFPALINLSLIGIALWQWKKRPLVSFGILFFFITLLPTFFNFHKGDFIFFAVDRYAYIPSVGLLLSLVLLGAEIFESLGVSLRIRVITIAIILCSFVGLSMRQTTFWDTPDTLFTHAIDLYPESVSARMAMGSVLRERNQLEEAFKVLHDGARYSDHPGLNIEAGLVYASAGQVDDARAQFQLALQKNPDLAPAMNYLGGLDAHDGKTASAMEWYRKAIERDPSFVSVRVHLARLLIAEKKYDDAFDQLTSASAWNPVSFEVIDAFIDLELLRKNASEVERWTAWKERVSH